jgi:hypothetical protein
MASGWCFLFIACCTTLDAAAAANYRDALLGIVQAYNIFKGTESTTVAVPPTVFQ